MTTSAEPSPASDEASLRAAYRSAGEVHGPLSALAQVSRGFTMGAADIVPGVSGGTVALVLGIYEHLIAAVREGALALGALLKLDPRGFLERLRAVDWAFLLPLLAGIGGAVVVLAGPLSALLEEQPVLMSALFVGLIVGSVAVASFEVARRDRTRLVVGLVVAVVTFLLLGIRGTSLDDAGLVLFFGAGAVAVCAMILPGISGSFILLMLGMYQLVLDAVHDRDVVALLVLAAGAVTGLALFSAGLNWLLREHRDNVLAALIGLMAGSLRVLWPWPAGEDGIGDVALGAPVASEVPGVLLAAGVGFVVVAVVGWWAQRATVDPVTPPV